jgi:hypothetical protein
MESLVPLLQAQDRDTGFRKMAGSAKVANAVLRPAVEERPRTGHASPCGQRIVIFCADNEVTSVAVSVVAVLARAGRDQVFLMTVVPTIMQQGAGKHLVEHYAKQLSCLLIQVRKRC